MDNQTNDAPINPYEFSRSMPSFNGAQEQTMNMIPLTDLFPGQFLLKIGSSSAAIGQALNQPAGGQPPMFNPDLDPKKLKRMIANRESAKKCRDKQVHHAYDMEKKVKELEMDVWVKRHQLMNYQQHNLWLKEEHKTLLERSIRLEFQNNAKESEGLELQIEGERLKQLLMLQQLNNNAQTSTGDVYFQAAAADPYFQAVAADPHFQAAAADPNFPNTYGPQF